MPEAVADAVEDLREQCDIKLERSRPLGGQQVGTDPGVITVTHRETGVSVTLPPLTQRSQHKRVLAALDAIEYLLESA